MSSTFGHLLRVTTFGESHGAGIGVIVDGCPAGLPFELTAVQRQLDRRRPGQSALTTPREEGDKVTLLSGVQEGRTLGTPIAMMVPNENQRPDDYAAMSSIPRPSHADYTYWAKYGCRIRSGGGRASARETIGRVAAGVVAESVLARYGVEIVAWVDSVGDVASGEVEEETVTRERVDSHPVRCPDPKAAARMAALIEKVRDADDSIGGTIACVCRGVPAGWGEPVFDKLDALLAHAMLSIPAVKGFEVGSGFAGARQMGSEHNDPFVWHADGRLGTVSNRSGGIQGGISNGEPVRFRVAFKPAATIGRPQHTVDYDGHSVVLEAQGRHDPCVLPRAVAVVEAMTALTLADVALRQNAQMPTAM